MSFLRDRFNFNLRERVNIHAGVVLGALTPTVFTRYLTVSGLAEPKGLTGEIAAWGFSLFTNLPSLLPSTILGGVLWQQGFMLEVLLLPIILEAILVIPILITVPDTLGRSNR